MRSFLSVRRRLVALVLCGLCSAAVAQPFPSKPLEWVVPYPAGGGTDVVARTLAEAMGKALGQSIIITNKPGAATNIATARRVKNFEDIPTLQEQGLKGFEAYAWQGVVVPAGTPADVVVRLNKALLAALDTTAVKARLQTLGLEAIPSSPERMAKYASGERAKWGRVIKDSGIKLD